MGVFRCFFFPKRGDSKHHVHVTSGYEGFESLGDRRRELVRYLMGYLQGEELPVALTNTRLLKIARSINEDRTLSAQRKSVYLSSGTLTTFVLKLWHGGSKYQADEFDGEVRMSRKLESVKILRAHDPPCPWDERTCSNAAEGGHLDVLQWARSHDPPCPWYEESFADYPWDYVH